MLKEGVEDVAVSGRVRWGRRSGIWDACGGRVHELARTIGRHGSWGHVGLQPVHDEAQIGILWVSCIRIDHHEGVGAIVAGYRLVVRSLEGDRRFVGGDCRLSATWLKAKRTTFTYCLRQRAVLPQQLSRFHCLGR
jgi:hypothetical protein